MQRERELLIDSIEGSFHLSTQDMFLYEVAVVAPLKQPLTYGQPEGWRDEIPGGTRVMVPLGKRFVTGYVLSRLDPIEPPTTFKIKPIFEISDPFPLFPLEQIPLFRWLSEYYHYPIGEVIRTALPAGLAGGSGRKILLAQTGSAELPEQSRRSWPDAVPRWVEQLLDKGELSPAATGKLWSKSGDRKLLLKWESQGWISIETELTRKQFPEKTEILVSFMAPYHEDFSPENMSGEHDLGMVVEKRFPHLKKSEKKTLELFLAACLQNGSMTINRTELTKSYSGAARALNSLQDESILLLEQKRVYRDPFGQRPPCFPRPEHLTPEQETVLSTLLPAIAERKFQPFLLHGVTGCGKTEVYLRTTEAALEHDLTALVMVPEIALSSQLEAHFFSRFGDLLAVLHSGLSQAQRSDQWQRIMEGKARVVIGARSAIFAPLAKPGLIIVDEEHEPAYKQDDGLRYHGRDVAVLRGHFAGCPVILGSATPSVTSFHHASQGKYTLLNMTRRVNEAPLPTVEIIDIGREKKTRPDLCFSNVLVKAMRENLKQRNQTLLFVNRRGYAGFMLCRDCGHIIQCKHCQVSLTLHKKRNRLICHYCGYSIQSNTICPSCHSRHIAGLGLGSEKIEEEVRLIFPEARIARLDSDTATSKKRYLTILQAVRDREVDILIGTQMIAKGLHFPRMTLVGVVWADSGLAIPDFRSSERTYQLLSQVTGRAGRSSYPGKVIIQTHQPDHYTIGCARQHDYLQLYRKEIAQRESLGYPPFSRMVNIRLNGADEKKVVSTSQQTVAFLKKHATGMVDLDILGPAPAPLVRIKNKTRWQILLKSSKPSQLHVLCEQLIEYAKAQLGATVQIVCDVDPENMM